MANPNVGNPNGNMMSKHWVSSTENEANDIQYHPVLTNQFDPLKYAIWYPVLCLDMFRSSTLLVVQKPNSWGYPWGRTLLGRTRCFCRKPSCFGVQISNFDSTHLRKKKLRTIWQCFCSATFHHHWADAEQNDKQIMVRPSH
jgi:hypothetical protein